MKPTLFAATLLAIGVGCATVQPEVKEDPEQIRQRNVAGFRSAALERAAFELRCDREAIRVVALNADPGPGAQVGVECGSQRRVYVFMQVGAGSAAWVAETSSDSSTN